MTDGTGKFLSAFIESFEKSLNPIKFALIIERYLEILKVKVMF